MIAHISILYQEADPATYSGVEVRAEKESEKIIFNSGDATIDYWAGMTYIDLYYGSFDPPRYITMGSSSIDHFVMDGGDFEWDVKKLKYEQIAAAIRAAKEKLETK